MLFFNVFFLLHELWYEFFFSSQIRMTSESKSIIFLDFTVNNPEYTRINS